MVLMEASSALDRMKMSSARARYLSLRFSHLEWYLNEGSCELALRSLVKPYIPRIKRVGDRGSPCLKPQVALKLTVGVPFRLIEKEAIDT